MQKISDELKVKIREHLLFEQYCHPDFDLDAFLAQCSDQWVEQLSEDAVTPYPSLDDVRSLREMGIED